MTHALELDSISKSFGNNHVLGGLTFDIPEFGFTGFIGANGAGKSTAIGIVTGLITMDSGAVRVFGSDLKKHSLKCRSQIGIMPQDDNLNRFETCFEILANQAGFCGIARKNAKIRAAELIKDLDLERFRDIETRHLSGGTKKRLMLARAVVHRPKMLILDEPTAGADLSARELILGYVAGMNKNGVSVMLTSHRFEEISRLCQDVVVLSGGKVAARGAVGDLVSRLPMRRFAIGAKAGFDKSKLDGLSVSDVADEGFVCCLPGGSGGIAELVAMLSEKGIEITSIAPESNPLEQYFCSIARSSEED